MTKTLKEELEALGKKAGKRIGQDMSQSAGDKAEQFGEKMGKTLGEQVDRAYEALEKEQITQEEQLGIGGKIGTGIGILGKRLVEKRYGFLTKFMGTNDLVSQGRVTGAKAEKIVKRVVKKQLGKIAAQKENKDNV